MSRTLPLQGGLPPAGDEPAGAVEVACDESGFSGTNLLDPSTPVFTHASVDLRADEAAALLDSLRSRHRWSIDELKSGQLLRSPHAVEARARLLGSLSGRAHVVVVDKEFFLATRVVDLLLADRGYASGTRLSEDLRPAALSLFREGRRRGADWSTFLEAFTSLVRTKSRRGTEGRSLDRFFRARDALLESDPSAAAAEVLGGLTRTRVRAVVDRLHRDDRSIPPPLEPLLPALAETVLFWSAGSRRVLVVHDEQSALTAGRLGRLQSELADEAGLSPLAGLVMADSRDDARVQVADLLAGLARRMPDAGPLAPFVSPTSLRDPLGAEGR
ncbi:MAG: DUF3800 domain-containing protein [Nocardioidaceae bacterium]